MMKYEKYKPSNIEWFKEVPLKWDTFRFIDKVYLKHGFQFRDYDFTDTGIKIIKISQLRPDGSLDLDNCSFIDGARLKEFKYIRIWEGDILMALTGGTIGKIIRVGNLTEPLLQNYRVGNFFPNKKSLDKTYLYFLLSSQITEEQINYLLNRNGQPNIGKESFKNMFFPLPPLDEQSTIAQYLDTKTQAIDKKIKLLTQKADLYKDLRKSIINDAICKGLNAKAKLKESGIEWLGKIPIHWEVKRLKNVCGYVNRGTSPTYVDYSDFKVINQATFSKGYLNEEKIQFTDKKNTERGTLKYGDILIASTGGGVLGKTVLFNKHDKNYIADSHVTIIRDNKKRFEPRFLHYFFSINFHLINQLLALGSTNQTELQKKELLALQLAIPPLAEQTQIANYLDEKTQKIDSIVSNIKKQLGTFTKLRKTLINDVVTGKIKVTNN